MSLKHSDGWNIPVDRPFYPPLPATYRNVCFQFVYFHADPLAVERLLPEPLEPAEDGACVACGLTVPFCTSYGPFQEAWVQEKCVFRGQTGWFCSHVLHNGPAGIAAGREVYGTPKVFASMKVRQVDRMMTTTGKMGGLPVITIASTMATECSPDSMPTIEPSWRLKIIPRADGPGPAIKQLVDGSNAKQDAKVHACFRGSGTVHFDPNPMCNLTGLEPKEYQDAYYLEMSFKEGYGKIAYDYLADR